jgi:hypothetical protein
MKPNELLFWLSARREGSWQQFRAAVEELHSTEGDSENDGSAILGEGDFPIYQQLRLNFERLGHAEFFTRDCEKGWRVAPPTLAAHPVSGGVRAVLCGARSLGLCERALKVDEKAKCKIEVLNPYDVPQVIRFVAPNISELQKVATHVGAHFQADAPLAILSHMQPCDPPSRGSGQAEVPVGADWHIHEFDTRNLRWQTIDRQYIQSTRTGLFKFQLYGPPRYFLRWKGETFGMSRAVALYVLLHRHRGLLHFDSQAGTLSLPGSCRPQRLLERALVLCSGIPPSFDPTTARLTYCNIPPEIAHFTSELLRQVLT